MIILKGINALPDFRQKQLLNKLREVNPLVKHVSAEYVHFAQTSRKLKKTELDQIKKLLHYGESFTGKTRGHKAIVTPRLGTISPWSSKATDIVRNSGIDAIEKLERGIIYYISSDENVELSLLASLLHDKMTETVLYDIGNAEKLFTHEKPRSFEEINLRGKGIDSLQKANDEMGLALSEDEIKYLEKSYTQIGRNPTDVELMMFSVVNSEHCRHKIFNASWIINGKQQSKSLFQKIKNTYEKNNKGILSAYSDNAAVLSGSRADRFYPNPENGNYKWNNELIHIVAKVETHNHPSAVAPHPGAGTGAGGEIRDEGATGRGAKPKMGLTGFTVSNLNIPGNQQPWEKYYGKPNRIVSALDIMIDGPIGGAAYNNEFGRPNLAGYFRTYEQELEGKTHGYHKPIMIAGGVGNIKDEHVNKSTMSVGTKLVVLGGPSMLIGLGGGTAASVQSGESEEDLDFASVQRSNAEIERRAQEVINACWALGNKNPITTIHDVGAGGLCNALPELVHDSGLGARIELRDIPNAESGMTPMEIWCNEAQERYVLGITQKSLKLFEEICRRERCPFGVVGNTTAKEQLIVTDNQFQNQPINIPMQLLFGNPPRMTRSFKRTTKKLSPFSVEKINIDEAAKRVLHLPAVASKKFLITIGDRSVGGLTVRDQMVGRWQVPVSDVAVTSSSFNSKTGEAMAVGERTPFALIDSAASARVAVGEAITNIAAAPIKKISDVKLSANWMAAAGYDNEDQQLYDAVTALGEEFCPALGVTIPVGKDSLSMRTTWQENQAEKSVTSPLSVIISGFAPVTDTSRVLTPEIKNDKESLLLLVDLGDGKNRLGGSALAQAYNQVGDISPDISSEQLKSFFASIQQLNANNLILAYHDRSDGGLFTTLCEMMFASRLGISADLSSMKGTTLELLFNEELGAVIQIAEKDLKAVMSELSKSVRDCLHILGKPKDDEQLTIKKNGKTIYSNNRSQLEKWWADTSYQLQRLRDNPEAADQEYKLISDGNDPGLSPKVTFQLKVKRFNSRPKAAIFREQGVNGQVEMAAAFDLAGFNSFDVHLNDIASGRVSLNDFSVLAACGGFSYGDVLGAGEGWAKSILYNPKLRREFENFFKRNNTLSLGVCNGCQMLSTLREIVPGTSHWPVFMKNTSEQFEARVVSVKINETPSIFFKGMNGSILPVPVAHGEGRALFENSPKDTEAIKHKLTPLQYTDNFGRPTEKYPLNPNGSPGGITSLTSEDGRATILMPHPERSFLTSQLSWHPKDWGKYSPWFKIFQNARQWVAENKS